MQDHEKWTALHIASWKGYTKLVEILLENKADVNLLTHDKSTALMLGMDICVYINIKLVLNYLKSLY